jgi:plasmid stabilization system protein ParE
MKRYLLAEKAAADIGRISERIAADDTGAALDWLEDIFRICQ